MSQNIPNNVGQTDSFKAKLLLYKYYRAHDIIYDPLERNDLGHYLYYKIIYAVVRLAQK